jgi:hypothetical protein
MRVFTRGLLGDILNLPQYLLHVTCKYPPNILCTGTWNTCEGLPPCYSSVQAVPVPAKALSLGAGIGCNRICHLTCVHNCASLSLDDAPTCDEMI